MISISIHSHFTIRTFYPLNDWQIILVTKEGVEITIYNDKPLALFAVSHFDPSPSGFTCFAGDFPIRHKLSTQDAARYFASLLEVGATPYEAAEEAYQWEQDRARDEALLQAQEDEEVARLEREEFTTNEQLSEAREAEHEAEPIGPNHSSLWDHEDERNARPKGIWNYHTLK